MSAVRVERQGPVVTIILHRPARRNAVDAATAQALRAAFAAFRDDETAHAAVLFGEGGVFCAGADLQAFAAGDRPVLDPDGPGPMGPTRMVLDKPVIAAINGYAVAGGLELALWCDLRVCGDQAQLGVLCRRLGVPLIDGGTVRLPRLIGQSHALDLILTGRLVGASEAMAMGLVNRVVQPDNVRATAEALAAQLAAFPQACLRGDLRSAKSQWGQPEAEALRAEHLQGTAALESEALHGAQRFSGGAGRHGATVD